MSRDLHELEIGIKMTDENSDSGISILQGNGAAGGDAGDQDAAVVGSIYHQRDGNGDFYKKKTAGSGTDKWIRVATLDDLLDLSFRDECVRAATGEALAAGVRDLTATPLTDDDTPFLDASDFVVGDYIISGVGGTVKLFEVTVVSAPNITLVEETTNPLASGDNFIVKNYLPDSPDAQEKQALVNYDGTNLNKIGDVNWDFATGINLSSGYSAGSGDITSADTVESAIEKLDGNNDAQDSALGVSQGDSNLGTYAGPQTHLTNNSSAKTGIQENANEIAALEAQLSANSVTTKTLIDSLLVDDYRSVLWQVDITLTSDETRVRSFMIRASHDGTTGSDAATISDTEYAKLNLGASFNRVVTVELAGAAGAQTIGLNVAASAAVNVRAQRVARVAI